MKNNWENYGDVNYLVHGGTWISKDEDVENSYYLVEYNTSEEGKYIVINAYVDLTDSWIEWVHVESYEGGFHSEIDKVRGAYSYYGASNFGGSSIPYKSESDALDELKSWGIKI